MCMCPCARARTSEVYNGWANIKKNISSTILTLLVTVKVDFSVFLDDHTDGRVHVSNEHLRDFTTQCYRQVLHDLCDS